MGESEDLGVAHVGGVGLAEGERDEPPGGQPGADRAGDDGPGQSARPPSPGRSAAEPRPETAAEVRVEEQPDPRANRREQGGDQVAEQGRGEQDGGQRPVASGAEARGDHPEEQEREREAEGEGELSGQGGEEVAPVDREAGLEEEGECGCRQAGRGGVTQPGQAAEGPGADREEQGAEHGDQFEGHVIGHHRVEQDGDQPGQREVEGVHREAVVPARVPAGQQAVGQEMGLEERREDHVCAGVPSRGGGVGHQQRRMELAQGDQRDAHHRHQVGPPRPRRPRGQPPEERRTLPRGGEAHARPRLGRGDIDRRGHLERGAEGHRRHDGGGHGHQIERGVGDHVHSEPAGPVGDARQDDPEQRQAQQLERFGVGQAEEHPGDHDGQGRPHPPADGPEQTGQGAEKDAPEEQLLEEGRPHHRADGDDDEAQPVRPAGQPLARRVEPLGEIVHVVGDGDVDQGHQDLPADPDRDPHQVGPSEAEPQVPGEALGAPEPGGQPSGPGEARPQAEQGGHDVPGRGFVEPGDGGQGIQLPLEGGGDGHEHGGQHLAAQEPEGGEQQPHPGRRPTARGRTGGEPAPEGPPGVDRAGAVRRDRAGDRPDRTSSGGRGGVCSLFGPLDHPVTIPIEPRTQAAAALRPWAMPQMTPGANSMEG